MKRILPRALLCALIVVVSMALLPASVSAAGIAIYVDDDFVDEPANHKWNTIQEGINDATNGAYDTVYVYAGTYNENVVVNKTNLTVHGESRSLVTVIGNGLDDTIKITASDVTVRQLKVTGATGTGWAGVYWGNVDNGYLEKSDITGNYLGVLVVSLVNQTIQCNSIYNNSNDGIKVRNSQLKDLTLNNIYSNGNDGISLINSTKITIWYNKSHDNGRYGIYVDSLSYDNDIYLNDFYNNSTADGYSAGSGNNWETPNKPEWQDYCYGGVAYTGFRGNYWGDYTGSDGDGNGIGDTPHSLVSEQDSYPLMTSYVNYPSTCGGSVPSCTPEEAPPSPPGDGDGGGDGQGCFIATAALGPDDSSVDTLRNFRDSYMSTNPVGSALTSTYYKVSPPIAGFIDDHPALKPAVRAALVPAVAISEVAVITTLAQKLAIVGGLAMASIALAVLVKRRNKALQCS